MNKSFLVVIFAVAFNNPINAMFEVASGTGSGALAGASIGAFFGPPGAVVGGFAGAFAGGMGMAHLAGEEHEERKRKEQEQLALWKNQREVEKEKWVRRDRIWTPLYYDLYGVSPAEKLAFEEYEQGKKPLVIAARPFSDNHPQAIEGLKAEIRERLLGLRQEFGKAVYGPTGQFVELTPAYKAALQARIQNPQFEPGYNRLKSSEFALIGKKLKELGIASSLFWCKSDVFESELTAVVAHIIDASVNAYALPLQEKLQQKHDALRKEQQALAAEQTAHVQTRAERNAALLGKCNALSQVATVCLEKSNLLREKQKLQSDLEEVEVAIEFLGSHLQEIKDENIQLQREITRRKRRSLERNEHIAAQNARILKLEKDLKEAREAFASCTLSK